MSWLDKVNSVLAGYATSTNENVSVGTINEVTPEQLKRKRNIQLIVSILIVATIVAVFYFQKPVKK